MYVCVYVYVYVCVYVYVSVYVDVSVYLFVDECVYGPLGANLSQSGLPGTISGPV